MSGKVKRFNIIESVSQRFELDSKLRQPNHPSDPRKYRTTLRSEAAVE